MRTVCLEINLVHKILNFYYIFVFNHSISWFSSGVTESRNCDHFGKWLKNYPLSVKQLSLYVFLQYDGMYRKDLKFHLPILVLGLTKSAECLQQGRPQLLISH